MRKFEVRLRYTMLMSLTLGFSLVSDDARSEDSERSQAAYLYQLSRFVQWPVFEPQQVFFSICLYKSDRLKPVLQEAQGRKIEGRPFRVVTINAFDNVSSCQILFARHLDGKAYQRAIKAIDDYPVLFCSDMPGFSKLGGTLEFKSIDDTGVRIAINVDRAKRSRLFISANLMEMVEKVYLKQDQLRSNSLPLNGESPLNGKI